MTGAEPPVDEDALRESKLILDAITAAGAGRGHEGRAADLTALLIFGRTDAELYGVFCGTAEYAVRAALDLNSYPQVPSAPHGGPWRVVDLLPSCGQGLDIDPGKLIANRFLTDYAALGPDRDEVVRLVVEIAAGGLGWVSYCLAHLISATAEVVGAVVAHRVEAGAVRQAR